MKSRATVRLVALLPLLWRRSSQWVLLLVRHPADVVLSVFGNELTHGFHCAFSLEGAATHFALASELVAQYRANLALRLLPVRYEDLVDDQEATVRRNDGLRRRFRKHI